MLQLEVAGTVIQLENDEAAVIVYCPPSWQGRIIAVKARQTATINQYLFDHEVQAITRGDVTAAVFPRIKIKEVVEDFFGWDGLSASVYVARYDKYRWPEGVEVTIYAGNITEVDWTKWEA